MRNDLLPTTLRCHVNVITIEVCHGEIPEIFIALRFDQISELELPDAKGTDGEFEEWLSIYRHASPMAQRRLLEETKCN